jgi:predicted outer membrane repeat protein
MKKLRAIWQSMWVDVDRRVRMGRVLGLLFVVAGFVVIGFGWNGAASKARVDMQFPYLLSGGFIGIGLIIVGLVLLLLATVRAERQILTDKFDEMNRLLSRNLGRLQVSSNTAQTNGSAVASEQVMAGTDLYHRPDCRILVGKSGLTTISVAQAVAEGLDACRACEPPTLPKDKAEEELKPEAESESESEKVG